MATPPIYPFTAIVGNERLKLALLLAVVQPNLGGVLIRGGKGSAKTTAVRALTALLPEIEVVRGCLYGCDPTDPEPCADCKARRAIGPLLPRRRRQVPLINLPLGATPDRVLGTLDVERSRIEGSPQFKPGLLAQANRGILYIDEVNLFDDQMNSLLLDAAAMGYLYVEREGFSIAHPARFILVGTMNPEEGELRPQLRDRFALTVDIEPLTDAEEREEVVRRRIAFDADPEGFVTAWAAVEQAERERLEQARTLVSSVTVPDALLGLIVRVCAAHAVDGLRADLAMYRGAVAHAAYAGRTVVTPEDVRIAAELALPYRQGHHAPEPPHLDRARLESLLAEAACDVPVGVR